MGVGECGWFGSSEKGVTGMLLLCRLSAFAVFVVVYAVTEQLTTVFPCNRVLM